MAQGALTTVQELLARAIDTKDAKLAGQLCDKLRREGCNYNEILARVQAARPNVTAAEWDALMFEADEGEG
jgi:hypothetical protein